MKPETGDKSILVTADDIAAALHDVGVVAGDVVMFHSSLSSMGMVIGGANAVIDGFLKAVGPEGTVVVPTLCNWEPDEQQLVFARWNPKTSPSYVGLITEVFRTRPGAVRSDHATHSVAAIGARALEITRDHGSAGGRPGPFGERAFAKASPWQKMYDLNAAYCFIGVSFRVNTMVHYVESLIVERALQRVAPDVSTSLAAQVQGWMRPGIWPSIRVDDREAIEGMLANLGIVRYGKIGSATLRCARARSMVDGWLGIVESDPKRWYPEDFQKWLKGGGQAL
jgi:aminoglycoside 3-N-acetyltransferase